MKNVVLKTIVTSWLCVQAVYCQGMCREIKTLHKFELSSKLMKQRNEDEDRVDIRLNWNLSRIKVVNSAHTD